MNKANGSAIRSKIETYENGAVVSAGPAVQRSSTRGDSAGAASGTNGLEETKHETKAAVA